MLFHNYTGMALASEPMQPLTQLLDFRRSDVLNPAETQRLSFPLNKTMFARYDATGALSREGSYLLRITRGHGDQLFVPVFVQ